MVKIKPVVFLLGLHFAVPTFAIGLGDLSVRSFLGQPLHATVDLSGAPPTLAADCLSLRASDNGLAAPAQARFRIERSGANALLHITTPRAVNDPVTQFVLIADCEGRLQREYVVLLDPPAAIAPAIATRMKAAEPQPETASIPAGLAPAPVTAQAEPAALAKPAGPAAATARPHRPAPRKNVAQAATPRLVISARDILPEVGNLPAGLEREAPPPTSSNPYEADLSPTELSDENTALNRRLAYLEAQLAALHERNKELEVRRAALKASAPRPVAEQRPQWPVYLLGLGLFVCGGLLAAWLMRQRNLPRSGTDANAPGAYPDPALPARADADAPLPRMEAMPKDDSLQAFKPETRAVDVDDIPLSVLSRGTEVKEDILDQAEVFVAHGHANLAIQMLQQHLHQAPTESPVPWLLLLDLLRREGDEAGYAAATLECKRHLNINLAAHPLSQDLDEGHGLENYPHTLEMLYRAWNTPDIDALFNDLIYDQRGGTRLGFEPGAYRDILLLRDIAQQKTLAMAA